MKTIAKIRISLLLGIMSLYFAPCKAQNTNFFQLYDYNNYQQWDTQLLTDGGGKYILFNQVQLTTTHKGLLAFTFDSIGVLLNTDTLIDIPNVSVYYILNQVALKYNNNTFYITGGLAYYDSLNHTDSARSFIAKYNANFKLIWLKTYIDSTQIYDETIGSSILKTNDGNLITYGQIIDTSSSTFVHKFYLLKTDTAGNVLWWRKYGNNKDIYVDELHKTASGGYLFSGLVYNTNIQYPMGTSTKAYYAETDSAGNLLWSQSYGTTFPGYPFDCSASCLPLSDGGILLAYVQGAATQNHYFGYYQIKVMRLNAQKQVLWSRSLGGITGEFYINKILPTSDGNFIIMGAELYKISGQGDSLWTSYSFADLFNNYGYYPQYARDIIETPDHHLMLSGYMSVEPQFLSPPLPYCSAMPGSLDAWVEKTDSNGIGLKPAPFNLTETVSYSDSTKTIQLNWQDTASNQNNRIYFILGWYPPYEDANDKWSGYVGVLINHQDPPLYPSISTAQKHWSITVPKDTGILKFQVIACDTMSYLYTKCSNIVTINPLGITQLKMAGAAVKIFPNPNNGSFMLKYHFKKSNTGIFSIFNLQGKELFQDKLSGASGTKEYTLHLAQGAYLYEIKLDNGTMKTGKMMLMR